MNAPFDATSLALSKFAIGQPVSRKEDPVLLRGQGRYTADIDLPEQAWAVMVRSRIAHGALRGIDTEAARAMPGVLAVLTAADLQAAGIGSLPSGLPWKSRDGSDMHRPPQFPLATDRVRFVGEPVAAVIAATLQQAKDAAEAVVPDIEAMPAATTVDAAVAEGAPLVHDTVPGNVAVDFHYGDTAKVDAAFARAAHVVRLSIRNNRVVVCAMEPRAAVGAWEDGRYVLRVGCQGVFGLRDNVRAVLGVERKDLRILTGNVGGSFGMKAGAYPEYFPLLLGARQLGRPVKWVDERTESFLSDGAGRDHQMDASLALDADGKFLAVRLQGYGNLGAYHANFGVLPATVNAVKNVVSVYATEAIEVATKLVFTNTTPVGPYRGAGRPEGNYYMERLIDTAARQIGIDRVKLRRRNHIKAFPYAAPSDMSYDSGDFPGVLDQALAEADWDGFESRRAESAARGKLRGRGIGQYLEVTAPPANEMGGIRFEADGGVTIITGTLDYGQGHASPFAQVLTTKLGVPFDRIRLLQGDSDELIAGGGTGGSKSIMASGAAIIEASEIVIEKGRAIAAHLLEAAEADIEFEAGIFRIAGTDRAIGVMELAERLRAGVTLPEGVADTLDVAHVHKGAPSAFPNGCHIAEVEVDPETGVAEVVRYTMVNDFGTVVNPLLVAGQAHGGVVQGIGQALFEQTHFDDEGQVLAGSFMDYALPRAGDAPSFAVGSHPVPATTNLLGAKGCGEAGCAGSLPSVMNALVDALAERGITHIDMPATPQRVWAALRQAGGAP
ncbi:MAG TPA: xanthine dehydrogenase family protein molybdopterin-binding subunit [Acidisphaera sp.]|nr:xanthine dehydrogenase family protein molybdopterin-binding subunit [Acidisphaera sp.]